MKTSTGKLKKIKDDNDLGMIRISVNGSDLG